MYGAIRTITASLAAFAIHAAAGAQTTVPSPGPTGERALLWLAEDGSRADALIEALRAAHAHALPAARYAPDALAEAVARVRAGEKPAADAEARLTEAFLRYARDVGSGVLEPRSVSRDIMVDPVRRPPALLLREAAAAADMRAHLASLAPADPDYAALKAAYAALRALPADAWGPPVADGPLLRPGARDPRATAIRRRLAAMGEETGAGADPALYDETLARAVRAFQRRNGLNADGVIGPLTRAALNASPADRAAQIAVNLERIRWLNEPRADRRIVVNQADFTVTMWDGGAVVFHERVVIGQTGRQTPEFSDMMTYLVFNPTWHVPRSIAVKDLLPKLQADPSYLARSNMRLIGSEANPAPADPSAHDFTVYTPATFPYRIRQNPDDSNALGRVKFMFPNQHAIYLHDTPSRNLFERDQRAFSSGCVRVRDPLRLAALLLAPQTDDPTGFIDRVLATGRERYVNLDHPIAVKLTYRTAWVDETGAAQFRADIYGRDARAIEALRALGLEAPDA